MPTTIAKILVALDLTHGTADICAVARQFAQAFGAELTLLHVAAPDPEFVGYDVGPQYIRDAVAHEIHEERHRLAEVRDELVALGLSVSISMTQGSRGETVLEAADRFGADLIVLGSHTPGKWRTLLSGSMTDDVVRHASVPVVVVPLLSSAANH